MVQADMEGSACLDVALQLCSWGFLPHMNHFLAEYQAAYAAKTGGQEHQPLLHCAAQYQVEYHDLQEVRRCTLCLPAGLKPSSVAVLCSLSGSP